MSASRGYMKYVVFSDQNGGRHGFAFSAVFTHKVMAKGFVHSALREGHELTPVSAGFMSIDGECFGGSESMHLTSSPEDCLVFWE